MRKFFALILLVVSFDASALSCIVPSVAERYEASKHVALIEVTEARLEQPEGYSTPVPGEDPPIAVSTERQTWAAPPHIVANILVIESYKG